MSARALLVGVGLTFAIPALKALFAKPLAALGKRFEKLSPSGFTALLAQPADIAVIPVVGATRAVFHVGGAASDGLASTMRSLPFALLTSMPWALFGLVLVFSIVAAMNKIQNGRFGLSLCLAYFFCFLNSLCYVTFWYGRYT